jgi:hypothetical protein
VHPLAETSGTGTSFLNCLAKGAGLPCVEPAVAAPELFKADSIDQADAMESGILIRDASLPEAILGQSVVQSRLMLEAWHELRVALPHTGLSKFKVLAYVNITADDTQAWLYWCPEGKHV